MNTVSIRNEDPDGKLKYNPSLKTAHLKSVNFLAFEGKKLTIQKFFQGLDQEQTLQDLLANRVKNFI